jgi:Type II secretion system (T2SS), protein M subtype b
VSVQRTSALLLAAVALAAGMFWAATGPLQARLTAAQGEQAALDAEAAALQGRIMDLSAIAEGEGLPSELLLAGVGRAEAVAALQERLVSLAQAHNVLVASVGEATGPEGLSHPATAVVIEAAGSQEDVIRFLAALEAQSPPVGLGQLMIRRQGAGQVSLRLLAWGLLPEEAG